MFWSGLEFSKVVFSVSLKARLTPHEVIPEICFWTLQNREQLWQETEKNTPEAFATSGQCQVKNVLVLIRTELS